MKDRGIEKLIRKEEKRQRRVINLIASENYASQDVLRALGSVFNDKYAEGSPGKRYYGGCEVVDELENLCKIRALRLFGLSANKWSVNVQPLSGGPANLAVYFALVPSGGKIMSLNLSMGGHLTHGHPLSASGKLWKFLHYGLNPKSETIDYEKARRLARKERPKLIVAGFSAYPRIIDFRKFRRMADEVQAVFLVDMSHFAGLVAGKIYPSPFPYADIVMNTTHKTLRGPRGALIFSKKEFSDAIDRGVFPGIQSGPHMHQIAAMAVCLKEAASPNFRKYSRQVVRNAKVLARELQKRGWRIVSGGTDSHLFLVDTWARGISGKAAQEFLEREGIIVNKNTIPFDTRPPFDPSGIRLGTPAVTTQGMKENEMRLIAELIHATLTQTASATAIRRRVENLAKHAGREQ